MKRMITFAVLIVATLLAIVYAVEYLNAPDLHPGDELVERECGRCGGSGSVEQPEPGYCADCGGDGQARFLIPGPNHPVRVTGGVAEGAANPHGLDLGLGRSSLLQPLPGAVEGATVRFERVGNPVNREFNEERNRWEEVRETRQIQVAAGEKVQELKTAASGRFLVKLKPGIWTVSVSVPGFEPFEAKLNLPIIEEEIPLDAPPVTEMPDEVVGNRPRGRKDRRLPIRLWRPGER